MTFRIVLKPGRNEIIAGYILGAILSSVYATTVDEVIKQQCTSAFGRTEPLAHAWLERLLTKGADVQNLAAAEIDAERRVAVREQPSR